MTATVSRNGTFPHDARSAAEIYLLRGLAPLPMPTRSKDPGYTGWESLSFEIGELDRHFPQGESKNVGILNGAPSGNTADLDLDCVEAVKAAPYFLPETSWVFGRNSAPSTHRIYRTDVPLDSAQKEHTDIDGKMLVELRGSRGLTVFPPSAHKESGEEIRWEKFGDAPAEIALTDLERAVRTTAAAALLARHWPQQGSRDRAALALTGALLRMEWTTERVSQFVEAVAVAANDEQAFERAKKADRTSERIEDNKTTWGWPKLAEILGKDGEQVTRKVREWLTPARFSTHEPRPTPPPIELPEPPSWPQPPGDEAFYGLPGRIVRAIEPASEADPAALLVQTLVMFGSVIGRGAYFPVEADRHHANEFVVLVGRSSKARKGTSFGNVNRLYREAEEAWTQERVQTGASSGEGLIWAVRDPIMKREKVKEKGEIRYEEVEADPGISDKRLLVYEPEFANVLKQTERQGNTLSAILRQAWDGNDLRAMTKNSPAKATAAHVSLIGHITSDELHRYLTATETANGYANRHLFVCTERSKLLPEGGRVDPGAWNGLQTDLGRAIGFGRQAGEVRRDEGARALWREIYTQLSEERAGLAGALLARAEAHVMRVAMIFALMDQSATISAQHLMAATAVWDYCERSVLHIFGDDTGDPVADDLMRLLRGSPGGLTRTEISAYFGRHQPAERIAHALGMLLRHRRARFERSDTGGRPTERWYAVIPNQGG